MQVEQQHSTQFLPVGQQVVHGVGDGALPPGHRDAAVPVGINIIEIDGDRQ